MTQKEKTSRVNAKGRNQLKDRTEEKRKRQNRNTPAV
jgi:hypothetical protein